MYNDQSWENKVELLKEIVKKIPPLRSSLLVGVENKQTLLEIER